MWRPVDTGQVTGMAQSSSGELALIDTQRTGRMGELVVELELLKRGFLVGNFNSTTMNTAGWDLFATKGRRAVKIRVKAKRPGVANFRWGAKADGRVFLGDVGDEDDFVVAVSFESDGTHHAWVLPTRLVAQTLEAENARWLSGVKRDGGERKATAMRTIYMDDRTDGAPGHGFQKIWATYRGAWHLLDNPKLGDPHQGVG